MTALDANVTGAEITGCAEPTGDELLRRLAAVIYEMESYRRCLAGLPMAELVSEHSFFVALVVHSRLFESPMGKMFHHQMRTLRDICVSEGIRRGCILHSGFDPLALDRAFRAADEMRAGYEAPFLAAMERADR